MYALNRPSLRRQSTSFIILADSHAITFLASTATTNAGEKKEAKQAKDEKSVVIEAQAPDFKIEDTEGNVIDLAELTANGPVLVRLTCGCKGCDKELAYFQALHRTPRPSQ